MRFLKYCLVGLVLSLSAQAHAATLATVEARNDQDNGAVTFKLLFDSVPDFATRDANGRLADAFQIFLTDGLGGPQPTPLSDFVVRFVENDGVRMPIRGTSPSVLDPNGGGFGSIVGETPFIVGGPIVTFDVPFALLSPGVGDLSFTAQSFNFGRINQTIVGTTEVPVPPPLLALITGLALFPVFGRLAQTRVNRPSKVRLS